MGKVTLMAARISAGMSRKTVSERLDVAESTIARWEQGNSRIDAKAFLELCEMYGFEASDIFLP